MGIRFSARETEKSIQKGPANVRYWPKADALKRGLPSLLHIPASLYK
jgi:hypothetical protein